MLEIRNQSDLTENHIKRKVAGYQRLSSNWLWLVTAVSKPSLADAGISHQYHNEYSGITINYDKVLVFYTQSYIFWGGAHGLEPSLYTCYDLQTGHKITLQDLFSNANKDKILTMIKHELIGKYYQEKTYLTDNFLLLRKGIRFVYNPYQIASYGDGHIVITLPLSKIQHLLKPCALTYFEE